MPSGYFKLKDGTIVPLDLTGSGSPDRLFMGESRMSPDTWQRTPDLLPSSGGVDAEMQSDFQRAKEVADYTLKSGGTAEDADKIGTQPVLMKYKILAASPELKDDPNKLEEFNSEYGGALQRFYQGIADGDKPEESSGKYLLPVQQKWISSSTLSKNTPTLSFRRALQVAEDETKTVEDIPGLDELKPADRTFVMSVYRTKHPHQSETDKFFAGLNASPTELEATKTNTVPKLKILSIRKAD